MNVMIKLMMRSLSKPEHRSHCDILRATANAMLGSVQIGATQAMYILLNQKFVRSSRSTITLNTLPKDKLTQRLLSVPELRQRVEADGNDALAVDCSPNSSLGRRLVYSELIKQQEGLGVKKPTNLITMFALFSDYRVSLVSNNHASACKKSRSNVASSIDQCDADDDDNDNGNGNEDEDSSEHVGGKKKRKYTSKINWETNPVLHMDGLYLLNKFKDNCGDGDDEAPANPNHFCINNTYRFSKVKTETKTEKKSTKTKTKRLVIHTSPYIPFQPADDRSAFSLLLLHTPWPGGEEAALVPAGVTPAQHLASLKERGELPASLVELIERHVTIQQSLDDQGTPTEGMDSTAFDLADEDDGCAEENDSGEEDDRPGDGEDDGMRDVDAADADLSIAQCFAPSTPNVVNLNEVQYQTGKDHIARLVRLNTKKLVQQNRFNPADRQAKIANPRYVSRFDDHEQLERAMQESVASMNTLQRKTFERIKSGVIGGAEQLLMIISGEAGTGKSYISAAVQLLSKIHYGKTDSLIGPCLVVAQTGSAAYNIKGFTWHSALNKNKRDGSNLLTPVSQSTANQLQGKLDGVEVVIIDEMSLISLESLVDINRRLQAAQTDKLRREQPFGGCHVILMGDFYQVITRL